MPMTADKLKTKDMGFVGVVVYTFGKDLQYVCEYDYVNDRCVWSLPNTDDIYNLQAQFTMDRVSVEPRKFLKAMNRVRQDMHNARRAAG